MKKIIALLLTVTVVFTLCLTSSASSVSVATELTNIRSYYGKVTELTRYEETVVFASMGMLAGRTPYIPEKDGSAKTLAERILAVTATGEIPKNDGDPKELKALQKEDGSFGDVAAHCLSMLALSARKEMYNSAKAYSWLMNQQAENGSFSDSAKDTALAICVLSLSENTEEQQVSAKAVKYLDKFQASNTADLCWQIMGITDGGVDANSAADRNLLENLLALQNSSDYSFYATKNASETDGEATILAFAALDTLNKDSSMFHRLAENGELKFFDIKDAVPLFIFCGVMLVISLGFWG